LCKRARDAAANGEVRSFFAFFPLIATGGRVCSLRVMPINVHVLPAGPLQTNAYLLTAPVPGEAVLIDAPDDVWWDVEAVLRREKCKLTELWLTHGHWDHTQGAADVARRTGAKVRAHRDDQLLLEKPELMNGYMIPGIEMEPVHADLWVGQGDTFSALGEEVEVRHVPGHCPGNVLFWFAGEKKAFVGDSLFAEGIGRPDLPGGNMQQLDRSIRSQIYTLPDETVVFPGHGPATTVGHEKHHNPYVRVRE
jgi:glyoxylase-like metal-dependent hydrolase (beta-lactamase superfamily II)